MGVTLAVCAMRGDWWRRAAIIGFACSIGWGVGGQSSYGILIGYCVGGTYGNSLFGFTALYIVGALYCGVGAGFLGLALTKPRSYIQQFIWPLLIMYLLWYVMFYTGLIHASIDYFDGGVEARGRIYALHDSLWSCVLLTVVLSAALWAAVPKWRDATALMFVLSVGWFVGMFGLIEVCDFRLNPDRAEAWAGVAGMLFALIGYLLYQKNLATLMLVTYGIIAGGLGFSCGNFIQMLGRGKWSLIAGTQFEQFFTWTMMEQFFGYCMGFGVALGVIKLVNNQLAPPKEDAPTQPSNLFAVFFLFGPLMFNNFHKHVRDWPKHNKIAEEFFGLSISNWYLIIGLAYMGILLYALYLIKEGRLKIIPASKLGAAQLLALLVIISVLLMYLLCIGVSQTNLFLFLLAISIGLVIILRTPETPILVPENEGTSPESTAWIPGVLHWILYPISVPVLLLLAHATMQFEMEQKQYRFPQPEQPQESEQSRFDVHSEPVFLTQGRSELLQ